MSGMLSPWVTIIYSIFVSMCASLVYTFGIYSAYLKSILGFSQVQITLVGTLGNVTQFTGLPAGLVYDKHGPRVTLLIGGSLAFTGFTLMYLVMATNWNVGIVTICALYSLASFSMTWYDTSNVITNVRNFPEYRGFVIGLSKAFTGLGAGIFAQLYLGFFKPNTLPFLLMVPFIAAAVAIGGAVFINQVPPSKHSRVLAGKYFAFLYAGTLFLAIYLASTALAQELLQLSHDASFFITLGMLALLLSFWGLLYFTGGCFLCDDDQVELGDIEEDSTIKAPEPDAVTASVTLMEALKELDIWLLFFAFFLVTGAGLMLINNVAQVSTALADPTDHNPNTRSVLVTLLAVGSTIGRLVCGALSESLLHKVPRTMFLTVVIALHGCIQLLLAHASYISLFPCCLFEGMCYGGYWALMPSICADLFGVGHLGAIYNFLHFGPSLGTLFLSTLIAGHLYDQEASRQGHGSVCYGRECFYTAFIVNAFACFLACVAAAWLQYRTRFRYCQNPVNIQNGCDSAKTHESEDHRD